MPAYFTRVADLFFAIINSSQLSSSEKSLAGKKFIDIFQGFYMFRFLLHRYFFHFLWQMPIYLVGYAANSFLVWRHLNIMLLTDFGNLNSILNIFQETHKFLDLTDLLIICIYLRTTDRHFRDQGNVHHLTSKLLKCNLVQTLNTSRNPSLRIFAAGKASLVSLYMHWY